jgi:hypothetical protein
MERFQVSGFRFQVSDDRGVEFGSRNAEVGKIGRGKTEL